jgi:glutaredoxin
MARFEKLGQSIWNRKLGNSHSKAAYEVAEGAHGAARAWLDNKLGYEERLEAVAHAIVEKGKQDKRVMVFSRNDCFNSKEAFRLFMDNGVDYENYEFDNIKRPMFGNTLRDEVDYIAGDEHTPHIFINGYNLGSLPELKNHIADGTIINILNEAGIKH